VEQRSGDLGCLLALRDLPPQRVGDAMVTQKAAQLRQPTPHGLAGVSEHRHRRHRSGLIRRGDRAATVTQSTANPMARPASTSKALCWSSYTREKPTHIGSRMAAVHATTRATTFSVCMLTSRAMAP